MAVNLATFKDSTARTHYESGTLDDFRDRASGTFDDLAIEIEALDARIAQFESVFITDPENTSTFDYPYDAEGLKREFLDEVTALLLRFHEGIKETRVVDKEIVGLEYIHMEYTVKGTPLYAAENALIVEKETSEEEQLETDLEEDGPDFGNFRGSPQVVLNRKDFSVDGVFDNSSDSGRAMLNEDGKDILDKYESLINAVFNAGKKLDDDPDDVFQVVTAIQPIVIDDGTSVRTYNRLANASDFTSGTGAVNAFFLLEDTAQLSRVVKDADGKASIDKPDTAPAAKRIKLDLKEAFPDGPTYQKIEFSSSLDLFAAEDSSGGFSLGPNQNETDRVEAVRVPALAVPVPDRVAEFPDVQVVLTHRARVDGIDYLIGKSTADGKIYATSLGSTNRSNVSDIANLNGLEYLMYFTEVRIRILRAKLSYNEAVVREIQDDLTKANNALAELENQAGLTSPEDPDEYSAVTLKMDLFNALASKEGEPIFNQVGDNTYLKTNEWMESRTNLKNYIDRRSAQAQQATLDYQNTLNRYNSSYEMMAKLQEKLDSLLKSQIGNIR